VNIVCDTAGHPIMNTQVLHHIEHGDPVAKPDLLRLTGSRRNQLPPAQQSPVPPMTTKERP